MLTEPWSLPVRVLIKNPHETLAEIATLRTMLSDVVALLLDLHFSDAWGGVKTLACTCAGRNS